MKKRGLRKLLCMFMLLAVAISAFSLAAYAAETDGSSEYYLSYKKYVAAVNPDGSKTITYNDITDQIANLLNEGVRRYETGAVRDGDDGYYKPFTNSYGFWYETSGFEKTVMGYISGARVNEVELQFSNMKKAVNNGADIETVKAEVDTLIGMLREDANILDDLFGYSTADSSDGGNNGSGLAWATFGAVFGIILREGLEAILIVGAMVAYLVKTNNKSGTRYVYLGAVIALIASVGLAILLYSITSSTSNSIPQEIVEGVTALVAVVVLIYVSNWMISKSESEAWTNYIAGEVSASASKGKMWALGFTSFLAVFREGAEVILFCQQYFSRAGSMNNGYLAVFGGIAVGLAAVAIIFVIIRKFGVKLPLKPFFMATSILMAVMSIAFLGSGMFELFLDGRLAETIGGVVQDLAGTIPALSWMNGNDVLAFFGIYPTYITLVPQIILLAVTIITFIMMIRKNSKAFKRLGKS
ncbi:MAG: FTR1 family iron permease [Clostridia bacterium]|nr:FTR1 family iron permease [Clostridia bacterium]